MTTLTQSRPRKIITETREEKVARLQKLSHEAKASGCTRCKSWDDFAKLVGLRS